MRSDSGAVRKKLITSYSSHKMQSAALPTMTHGPFDATAFTDAIWASYANSSIGFRFLYKGIIIKHNENRANLH